jgi:hypothetical protein
LVSGTLQALCRRGAASCTAASAAAANLCFARLYGGTERVVFYLTEELMRLGTT